MKNFDLNEYLGLKEEGLEPSIVTRDGKPVRIVCTDQRGFQPVVALVLHDLTDERPHSFHADGSYLYDREKAALDLFFVPTKRKGWVNVFIDGGRIKCGNVYETEAKAKFEDKGENHIATVLIEWEE